MSVYQLVDFMNSDCPQMGAIPNCAWKKLMDNGGPAFVPSKQTCFAGGISTRPHVSERRAGAIYSIRDERDTFDAVDCSESTPNVCFAYSSNVFKKKGCSCGLCKQRDDIVLYR